jgi:hypothetical protein
VHAGDLINQSANVGWAPPGSNRSGEDHVFVKNYVVWELVTALLILDRRNCVEHKIDILQVEYQLVDPGGHTSCDVGVGAL